MNIFYCCHYGYGIVQQLHTTPTIRKFLKAKYKVNAINLSDVVNKIKCKRNAMREYENSINGKKIYKLYITVDQKMLAWQLARNFSHLSKSKNISYKKSSKEKLDVSLP